MHDAETEEKKSLRVSQIQLDEETRTEIMYLETVVVLDNEISAHASTISQTDRRLNSAKI